MNCIDGILRAMKPPEAASTAMLSTEAFLGERRLCESMYLIESAVLGICYIAQATMVLGLIFKVAPIYY
jgi:hypothetical protein